LPFTPGVYEASITVIDDDRVVTAAIEIDIAIGISADTSDVGMGPTDRKLLPSIDQLKPQGT